METITAAQTTAPRATSAQTSGTIDADAAARLARLQQRRSAATRPTGTGPKAPEQARSRRRRHAAKGSRIAALSLSVLATSGLTVAFASADRSEAATVASSTATAAKASTATAAKTFTGIVDQNKWGPVQVKITTSGGRITNVTALQTPDSKQKSVAINNRAVPVLKSEAITAQSAQIDNVSGATYTTDSYKVSVQSAIDKAVAAGALAAA